MMRSVSNVLARCVAWKSSICVWMVASWSSTTLLYSGVSSSIPDQSQTEEDAHPGQYTRIRSSSMERQKMVDPGSPCLPARPRSWLSTRRESCNAVPTTCKPPISRTKAASFAHCVSQSAKRSIAACRNAFTTGFGPPCFSSSRRAASSAAVFTAPPRAKASACSTALATRSTTASGATGNAWSASATTRANPAAARADASVFELVQTLDMGSGASASRASSDPGESCGNRSLSKYDRHKPAAFPPRTMSVPRPAMFVAIVTALARPAWLTISASRAAS
mmetsp:Transcript_5008/g.20066  ORF Transcript_5008/g.20066 Transcript_5008/m.20066 type:complete len:279 (-) Transcript_5008:1683-2519(-)